MGINKQRPVNLSLSTIHFPITAITSILHRISGVALFLFLPYLLWMLDHSLQSAESFARLQECLSSVGAKLLSLALLAGVIYHSIAGVRHLIMDWGYWEEISSGRTSAWILLIITIALTLALGVWLWV